jgi:predicted Zn-dependent protease
MLQALARQEQFVNRTRGRDEARSIPEWARTHPLTSNRIERAREAASATGLKPGALPEKEAAYLRRVDGLLYGDDPEQGFVMGRAFAHPVMRIGFEAPPGFTLTNSPQAILIEGPDGMRGEFAGGPMPPTGLEGYASAVLEQLLKGASVQLGVAQQLAVNGLAALIVPGTVETSEGPVSFSLAAYQGQGGSAYHFIIITGAAGTMSDAVGQLFGSFRLLSEAEARSLRPRTIDVRAAGATDTIRSLAAQMAGEHKLAHFLVLNGRSADQALRPGELVKLAVYASP